MFFIRKEANIDPSNFENNKTEKLFHLQGCLTLIDCLDVAAWTSHDRPMTVGAAATGSCRHFDKFRVHQFQMPARYAAMSLVLKMAFEFSSIEMSIWPRRRRTAPRHRFCPLLLAGPTLSNCMNIFLISRVHQRPASIIHTATNNQSLPVYQLTRSTQSFAHQSHFM